MTYRVLLAARDPSIEPQVRGLLRESDEFDLVRVVTSTAGLLPEVSDRPPDVVVLHEGLGPAPALAIVRDLVERQPELAVVLIVKDGGRSTLSAAMEAGARGVLTLPMSYADVRTRLASAAAWSVRVRSRLAGADDPDDVGAAGRLIAVTGAKGGCGATTVATQLALAAVRPGGRRVCLVDLDLQSGDVASAFGVKAHHDIADLVEVADELTRQGLIDVMFRHDCGLQILPAPDQGERAETVTTAVTRRVLGVLRTIFDVVVVDCGSVVTDGNLGAVEIADRVLVVSTPDILALRGAHRLTALYDRLQVRKPAECDVILNRTSRRSVVQRTLARRVVEAPLCASNLPARFRRLETSVNTGSAQEVGDRRLKDAFAELALETGLLPERPPAGRRRRKGDDAGLLQSVQFALTVPALLLLVLLVGQALLIGSAALAAQREAAQAAQAVLTGSSLADVRRVVAEELPPGFQLAQVERHDDQVAVAVLVPALLPGIPRRITVSAPAVVGQVQP